MTTVLISLVVLVGTIAILNLLLTVGVIRRLREHTEQLANRAAQGGPPMEMMAPAGEQVGEFAATTIDGEPVSRDLLSGRTLVAVFVPHCPACQERMPEFLSYAKDFPGGRGQVLAVLGGEPAEVESYRSQLAPVARVVIEPDLGPVAGALRVSGYPTFGLLDAGGTVVASGPAVAQLPAVDPAGMSNNV